MNKTTVMGADFKEAVTAVAKFPSVGSFAGSEVISLQAVEGKLTATTFGIVLSRARIDAKGDLALVGIDQRIAGTFASLCPDTAKVVISILSDSKEVYIQCRSRWVKVPMVDGQAFKVPSLKEIPGVKLSKDMASRVAYLAELAFSDSSKAELCCVMLTTSGQAIACNQKAIAVMKTSPVKPNNAAVPVALAKAMTTGDVLYVGARETVLRSGVAVHTMPSAVKAQKDFPLASIKQFGKIARVEMAACSGQKMSEAVAECLTCLSQIARTEIIGILTIADGKMNIQAKNGGAKFNAEIPLLSAEKDGEFRVALDGISKVSPFMGSKVVLSRGKHGELFLGVESGWVMFPSWIENKKAK